MILGVCGDKKATAMAIIQFGIMSCVAVFKFLFGGSRVFLIAYFLCSKQSATVPGIYMRNVQ